MLDVLIIGGGPVGTLLANELILAGVDIAIVERHEQPTQYSRALGVHARTLEILDLRGLVEKFLDRGLTRSSFHFGLLETWLDFSALDTSHPYMLVLAQAQTEALLRAHLQEQGTLIQYGCKVVALKEQQDHVDVTVEGVNGRSTLRAKFVVGCDGSYSIVRTQADIPFIGNPATMTSMIADMSASERPPANIFNENGCILSVPLRPNFYRFGIVDPQRFAIARSVPVTFEEVQASLNRIAGTDFGIHDPQWLTRFDDRSCQAEVYQKGRVFLAGDAAHIHPPTGGQGLNVGLQDAMNLGWKLAAYLQGRASYEVLESYHKERHLIGEGLMENTQVQMLLMSSFSAAGRELRSWTSSLLKMKPVNQRLANQISALDTAYAPVFENLAEHPLNGARLPNLFLTSRANDTERLYQSFHEGNFVLLNLTGANAAVAVGIDNVLQPEMHVKRLQAHVSVPYAPLELVRVVLLRPDGHIAWASNEKDDGQLLLHLSKALSTWCSVAP